jgi:formylglycine-generating enzyme required for sulfatase activity
MALDFSTLRKQTVLGPEHRQFQLIKPVSNSPIGQVWHAYDLSTGTDEESREKVALEILNPTLLKNADVLEQFKSLVTRATHLEHKHLAKVYGYFQSREGWLFVAMEPLSTRSLARILIEDGYKQLNADKARVILQQIAITLDYVAKNHLSHGDLTPWNVIITHEVGVKLVNTAFRQPLLYAIQTGGNRVLNSEYHPPEAFGIEPLGNSGDIYSFACLIYLLFGGRAPFSPDIPPLDRDPQQLPAPGQFTPEQWQLLQQSMDESPGIRPASALELLRQLFLPEQQQALKQDTPLSEVIKQQPEAKKSSSTPSASASTSTSGSKSSGWLVGSVLAACITFGAGLTLGYFLATKEYNEHQEKVLSQVVAVQKLLQQPPTIQSKIALSKAFASLRELSPGPELLQQLGTQVDGFNVRLTRDSVNKSAPSNDIGPETASGVAQSQQSGKVFKDEIIPGVFGPNMITIPTGTFEMGDLDRNGDDNELPVHQVTIKHSFALSQKEVTFAEYDLFALSTGRPLPSDEGWGRGERPVINISWNDANSYAYWIRQQTNQPYRLPSEAEWEYAARSGNQTLYWWGNEVGTNNAACDDCGSAFDGKKTAPTGSFTANAFGLHDMNGNVYEWVSDCYNDNYDQAPKDGSSWNVGLCNYRVMRGGSWYDIPRLIRSASRYRHPPNASRNTWGFRLALDLKK